MRKRVFKNKVSIRKKIIINLSLFMLIVMGVGFSYLNTNLSMNANIEVAKLKIACDAGEYLRKNTKTKTDCPAGSFCTGSTYSFNRDEDQGIVSCAIGSYSAVKSNSCTACQGKTTSDIGTSSCDTDCSNKTGVDTWVEATWNSNNTISNLCTINTCSAGYTKNENICNPNTYNVTLNPGENTTTTGSENVVVTYNAGVPTITPPTKRGYNFGGYYYVIEHDDPEPDEEIKYINEDGTSAKDWNLIGDKTLVAKWNPISITCQEGEYLPADATSCSICPEGSSCPGGNYNFNPTTDQGKNICQSGTYSTGGATTCTTCTGGTNSTIGATTCGESCSNAAHVSTWSSACNIAVCELGYENVNNVCSARQFNITLDNKGANVTGSTSVTATYNSPVPSITIPEKTGYTFGGYYTEDNGSGTRYIKEDGTSAKDWDIVNVDKLYAKWTVISRNCSAGEYLPQGSTTCTGCLAGSFCPGGNYSYKANEDQGITACAVGSFSGTSASSCTMCSGSTTSGTGKTSCDANCSNQANVSDWNNASWNNNTPTGICSIKTCAVGYSLSNNTCTANELVFEDEEIEKNYSTSSQTSNVTGATNGTGTYTYTKKSGESDITVSTSGEITIPAEKTAGTYTIVITVTDSNSNVSKDATYTIKIKKVAANLSCTNKTYDGTEQTACTCTGGTVGGDYKATNAGDYTASCVGDANHNSPSNVTWTMNKKEIAQVTNLTIAPTGVVSWTNSNDADSYQISIDNTNWTNVPAGTTTTTYNFLNSIVGGSGERTVYVKGVNSDTTNYSSTSTNNSTNVYAVTFTVDDDTKGQVSPTSLNVITGSTYTTTDNVLTLQDGRSVTATPKTATGVTNSFDSWSSASGTITAATTITANFTSAITNYNVTYNSDTGTFTDSSTTNSVSYNVTTGTVTKYSHTANVDDTGLKTANYGNSWNNSNITGTERGDKSKAHIVSIPGASSLTVDIYYNGQGTSYDWLSVWAGSYPTYTAYSNYNSTGKVTTAMGGLSTNKYGGSQSGSYTVNGNSLTSMGHKTLTISGDSVTFSYYSNASSYGQGYGYYAIVSGNGKILTTDSGTYQEPTKTNYVFTGWNTEPDGTGTSILYESQIVNLSDANVTLYAQYRESTATFTTGQLFNAAIKQASGSSGATYSTTNSNITNFTKYTGTFTDTIKNSAVKVSSDDSESDIYAWFDNGTIYYYTTSDTIYFNPTSTYMFNYLTNLTTLDLSNFNLSKVTSSSSIFSNMTALDTIITPKVNSSSSISIGKTMMNQSGTTYSSITSSTPTETTLKVPYTITFDLNGGMNSTCSSIANTKQIYPGNPLATIPIISTQKFGYTQSGWCSDIEGNSCGITAETIPPSSITYYIQWTKDGVWAENISYSHSGIDCSDTQCILEYLANNYKEKRVSINGN